MKNIEFIRLQDCEKSDFVQPKRLIYKQNGVEKGWDLVDTHNSVAILLYHEQKDSFIFVKQFRPAIYLKNQDGFTYELCAGIMDKNLTPLQTAIEEIEEETGYRVPEDKMQKVSTFYTAVGIAGGKQTLFYANVDDSMKVSEGGGDETEEIEVIYLKKDKAQEFMFDENIATTSGLMFALMWFFQTKCS